MIKLSLLTCFLLCTLCSAAQVVNLKRAGKKGTTDLVKQIEELITTATASKEDEARALLLLTQAAQKAKYIQHDFLQGRSIAAIGAIYFQQKLYNRAFINYTRAGKLFYRTGAYHEAGAALLGIAKSHYYRGSYSKAAQSFVGVIKRSEQYGLLAIRSEANEYLGLIYSVFQNFSRSTQAFCKSLRIKQALKDDKGIVRVSGKLGEICYQQGQFDSAVFFANMSFAAAKKLDLSTDMYMAKFTKTSALIRLKKLHEAEAEMRFFEHANHHQDVNLLVRYQTLLGNYYLAMKNEASSKMHYDSAIALIKQNTFPELLLIVYNDMATAYYAEGDINKAYESYKKYNRQLSLFYTGENITKLANLEGLVALEDSKDEISQLSIENKLKAVLLTHEQALRRTLASENLLKDSILVKEKLLSDALTRENRYKQEKLDDEKQLSKVANRELLLQEDKLISEKRLRVTLLAALVLFIALGSIVFFFYRQQRKKNSIIQKQADDLQTLMKEIHHRVKNNLQIISSLLDLQSLSMKDKQAAGAVREGKMRVQSMALIHQNLYNEGNIKGIIIEDYIKNLVENLFHSYNIEASKIKLVTHIEHLNLDVDTVIPLGLIINELISNSLKYAFKKQQSGEIIVALKEINNHLELIVKDNGCGFPPNWNQLNSQTFGYSLIRAFAQKLKAKLEISNDSGACVVMNIMRYKMA